MKYILTIIITFLSVYAQANEVTEKQRIWKCLSVKTFKKWGTWLILFLCALSCYCLWKSDYDADRRHDEDVKRSEGLQRALDSASNRLEYANVKIESQDEKLDAATNKIERQARIIEEQQRTIGSIACNTQATLEGKRRFIRCFRDLSRYTKLNTEGMIFEGLICDDGVAMYWFRNDTEQMTGFHFFSDAELIRILSGLPNDAIILAEEGKLHIDQQSLLAIALNDSMLKQTPSYTQNPVEQDKAMESVVEEIKVVLQYVYRARSIQSALASRASASPQRSNGVSFSFKYFVDPLAVEKVEGVVPFPNFTFEGEFLQGLCGIDKATLSSRVIEKGRSMGVEPKVKIRDIQSLNRIYERKARLRNSPFDNARPGDK